MNKALAPGQEIGGWLVGQAIAGGGLRHAVTRGDEQGLLSEFPLRGPKQKLHQKLLLKLPGKLPRKSPLRPPPIQPWPSKTQ